MDEREWLECTDPRPMLEYLEGPASIRRKHVAGRQVRVRVHDKVRISDRKARLFCCACCRRLWRLLDVKHCRHLIKYGELASSFSARHRSVPSPDSCHKAVELAERSAEEAVNAEELRNLSQAAFTLQYPVSDYAACYVESWGPFDTKLMASGAAVCVVSCATEHYPPGVKPSGVRTGAFDCLGGVALNTATAVEYLKTTKFGEATGEGDPKERAALCALLREIVGNPFHLATIKRSCRTSTIVALAQAAYDNRTLPAGTFDPDRLAVLADALEEAGCTDAEILGHLRGTGTHVRGCFVIDLLLDKK